MPLQKWLVGASMIRHFNVLGCGNRFTFTCRFVPICCSKGGIRDWGYLTVCLPEFCGWLGIQLDYWVVYDLSISCIIYITIIKYGVYLNSTFMGISCLVCSYCFSFQKCQNAWCGLWDIPTSFRVKKGQMTDLRAGS